MIRFMNRSAEIEVITTIEQPAIYFIDLIFWLVGLIFGVSQIKFDEGDNSAGNRNIGAWVCRIPCPCGPVARDIR
jgi:hypothetical protein